MHVRTRGMYVILLSASSAAGGDWRKQTPEFIPPCFGNPIVAKQTISKVTDGLTD